MKILFNILFFLIITNTTIAKENMMILKLKDGNVKIELFPDVAPKHVERIVTLANEGKYDNVVFHRVIEGFMAQTGDVQFGNSSLDTFDLRKATLQEITFIGTYCFTNKDFEKTLNILNEKKIGLLDWIEYRELKEGSLAFKEIHDGSCSSPKIILLVNR